MPTSSAYQCPFCGGEARVGAPCPGCTPKPTPPPPPPNPKPRPQDEVHDALDLPDEDFDYEDFVAREFGRAPHRRLVVKWFWWALGLGLATLLLVLIALNRW